MLVFQELGQDVLIDSDLRSDTLECSTSPGSDFALSPGTDIVCTRIHCE